jgi:hypothetical protein
MKKLAWLVTTSALLAGYSINAADDDKDTQTQPRTQAEQRATRIDIDRRIQAINRLDNRPDAKTAGLAAISKATAVPLPTIEAEVKDHPNLGLAGIFLAHELSTHTHKPVDQFIRQRASGKTWTELARANGEDLAAIDAKLARIEEAMRNSGAAASASTPATDDRTPVRERERAVDATSSIDRRVNELNRLDNQGAALRQGLAAVSKETAVPLPTLEEAHKQHPNAGIGALLIAQEIAVRTQKPMGDILRLHSDGKPWSEIAKDHNQDVTALEQKLGRVEQVVRDAEKQ